MESRDISNELQELIEDVWWYYAPGGIYGDTFDDSLTMEEVISACRERIEEGARAAPDNDLIPFSGDTTDREMVRDSLLKKRGLPEAGMWPDVSYWSLAAKKELEDLGLR